MFNMLNTGIAEGKKSPMVCKSLSRMSAFPHGPLLLREQPSYLLEQIGLRNCAVVLVGLRIAFLVRRPTSVRIRIGKD